MYIGNGYDWFRSVNDQYRKQLIIKGKDSVQILESGPIILDPLHLANFLNVNSWSR